MSGFSFKFPGGAGPKPFSFNFPTGPTPAGPQIASPGDVGDLASLAPERSSGGLGIGFAAPGPGGNIGNLASLDPETPPGVGVRTGGAADDGAGLVGGAASVAASPGRDAPAASTVQSPASAPLPRSHGSGDNAPSPLRSPSPSPKNATRGAPPGPTAPTPIPQNTGGYSDDSNLGLSSSSSRAEQIDAIALDEPENTTANATTSSAFTAAQRIQSRSRSGGAERSSPRESHQTRGASPHAPSERNRILSSLPVRSPRHEQTDPDLSFRGEVRVNTPRRWSEGRLEELSAPKNRVAASDEDGDAPGNTRANRAAKKEAKKAAREKAMIDAQLRSVRFEDEDEALPLLEREVLALLGGGDRDAGAPEPKNLPLRAASRNSRGAATTARNQRPAKALGHDFRDFLALDPHLNAVLEAPVLLLSKDTTPAARTRRRMEQEQQSARKLNDADDRESSYLSRSRNSSQAEGDVEDDYNDDDFEPEEEDEDDEHDGTSGPPAAARPVVDQVALPSTSSRMDDILSKFANDGEYSREPQDHGALGGAIPPRREERDEDGLSGAGSSVISNESRSRRRFAKQDAILDNSSRRSLFATPTAVLAEYGATSQDLTAGGDSVASSSSSRFVDDDRSPRSIALSSSLAGTSTRGKQAKPKRKRAQPVIFDTARSGRPSSRIRGSSTSTSRNSTGSWLTSPTSTRQTAAPNLLMPWRPDVPKVVHRSVEKTRELLADWYGSNFVSRDGRPLSRGEKNQMRLSSEKRAIVGARSLALPPGREYADDIREREQKKFKRSPGQPTTYHSSHFHYYVVRNRGCMIQPGYPQIWPGARGVDRDGNAHDPAKRNKASPSTPAAKKKAAIKAKAAARRAGGSGTEQVQPPRKRTAFENAVLFFDRTSPPLSVLDAVGDGAEFSGRVLIVAAQTPDSILEGNQQITLRLNERFEDAVSLVHGSTYEFYVRNVAAETLVLSLLESIEEATDKTKVRAVKLSRQLGRELVPDIAASLTAQKRVIGEHRYSIWDLLTAGEDAVAGIAGGGATTPSGSSGSTSRLQQPSQSLADDLASAGPLPWQGEVLHRFKSTGCGIQCRIYFLSDQSARERRYIVESRVPAKAPPPPPEIKHESAKLCPPESELRIAGELQDPAGADEMLALTNVVGDGTGEDASASAGLGGTATSSLGVATTDANSDSALSPADRLTPRSGESLAKSQKSVKFAAQLAEWEDTAERHVDNLSTVLSFPGCPTEWPLRRAGEQASAAQDSPRSNPDENKTAVTTTRQMRLRAATAPTGAAGRRSRSSSPTTSTSGIGAAQTAQPQTALAIKRATAEEARPREPTAQQKLKTRPPWCHPPGHARMARGGRPLSPRSGKAVVEETPEPPEPARVREMGVVRISGANIMPPGVEEEREIFAESTGAKFTHFAHVFDILAPSSGKLVMQRADIVMIEDQPPVIRSESQVGTPRSVRSADAGRSSADDSGALGQSSSATDGGVEMGPGGGVSARAGGDEEFTVSSARDESGSSGGRLKVDDSHQAIGTLHVVDPMENKSSAPDRRAIAAKPLSFEQAERDPRSVPVVEVGDVGPSSASSGGAQIVSTESEIEMAISASARDEEDDDVAADEDPPLARRDSSPEPVDNRGGDRDALAVFLTEPAEGSEIVGLERGRDRVYSGGSYINESHERAQAHKPVSPLSSERSRREEHDPSEAPTTPRRPGGSLLGDLPPLPGLGGGSGSGRRGLLSPVSSDKGNKKASTPSAKSKKKKDDDALDRLLFGGAGGGASSSARSRTTTTSDEIVFPDLNLDPAGEKPALAQQQDPPEVTTSSTVKKAAENVEAHPSARDQKESRNTRSLLSPLPTSRSSARDSSSATPREREDGYAAQGEALRVRTDAGVTTSPLRLLAPPAATSTVVPQLALGSLAPPAGAVLTPKDDEENLRIPGFTTSSRGPPSSARGRSSSGRPEDGEQGMLPIPLPVQHINAPPGGAAERRVPGGAATSTSNSMQYSADGFEQTEESQSMRSNTRSEREQAGQGDSASGSNKDSTAPERTTGQPLVVRGGMQPEVVAQRGSTEPFPDEDDSESSSDSGSDDIEAQSSEVDDSPLQRGMGTGASSGRKQSSSASSSRSRSSSLRSPRNEAPTAGIRSAPAAAAAPLTSQQPPLSARSDAERSQRSQASAAPWWAPQTQNEGGRGGNNSATGGDDPFADSSISEEFGSDDGDDLFQ